MPALQGLAATVAALVLIWLGMLAISEWLDRKAEQRWRDEMRRQLREMDFEENR